MERCLESLINQTHEFIEGILIDDYSFDNTLEILEEHKKSNNNIKLI